MFVLHLRERWQQIELIHWLRGRPRWAAGFLIVNGNLGVEGNSVQSASLPCVGAQRVGQADHGRDISMDGSLL